MSHRGQSHLKTITRARGVSNTAFTMYRCTRPFFWRLNNSSSGVFVEQVILDLGKRSYFAFVEEAILVHGKDFSVFVIGKVYLRGQFLINLICTQCNLCNLGKSNQYFIFRTTISSRASSALLNQLLTPLKPEGGKGSGHRYHSSSRSLP